MAFTHASGELILNQKFRITRNGGEHRGVKLNWAGFEGTVWLNWAIIISRTITRQSCVFDNNSKFNGNNHKTITRQCCDFDENSEFTGKNHEFHWKIT